jgi:hypothetical protein
VQFGAPWGARADRHWKLIPLAFVRPYVRRARTLLAAALTLDAILVSFAVRPLDHAFPLTIFHGIATAVLELALENWTEG